MLLFYRETKITNPMIWTSSLSKLVMWTFESDSRQCRFRNWPVFQPYVQIPDGKVYLTDYHWVINNMMFSLRSMKARLIAFSDWKTLGVRSKLNWYNHCSFFGTLSHPTIEYSPNFVPTIIRIVVRIVTHDTKIILEEDIG